MSKISDFMSVILKSLLFIPKGGMYVSMHNDNHILSGKEAADSEVECVCR